MWGNLVLGRAGQLGLKRRSGQALEFTGPADMWINVTNLPGGKAGPSGPREPGRPVIGPWCVCLCYPTQPGGSLIDWQLSHSWAHRILLLDLSASCFEGMLLLQWDLPAPSRETALSEEASGAWGPPLLCLPHLSGAFKNRPKAPGGAKRNTGWLLKLDHQVNNFLVSAHPIQSLRYAVKGSVLFQNSH